MSHPSSQLSVQSTSECMGNCLFGELFASCRKSGMKWPVPPLKMEMWGTHVTLVVFHLSHSFFLFVSLLMGGLLMRCLFLDLFVSAWAFVRACEFVCTCGRVFLC